MRVQPELWMVAERLSELRHDVVFVGGMIRGLLVTDPAAGPIRPTNDVDCIIDVTMAGRVALHERLRALGFREDTSEDAPTCRWKVSDVTVDIMPIDAEVLGFSNTWFSSGMQHSISVKGPAGEIRVADAPHFCAMKVESFLDRGKGDYYHHDMEDLLVVIAERGRIVEDLDRAPTALREFVAGQMAIWVQDSRFVECVAHHLPPDDASQQRLPVVKRRIDKIATTVDRLKSQTRRRSR